MKPQKRAFAKFHAGESDCVYGSGGDGEREIAGDGRNAGVFAIKLYQIRD